MRNAKKQKTSRSSTQLDSYFLQIYIVKIKRFSQWNFITNSGIAKGVWVQNSLLLLLGKKEQTEVRVELTGASEVRATYILPVLKKKLKLTLPTVSVSDVSDSCVII